MMLVACTASNPLSNSMSCGNLVFEVKLGYYRMRYCICISRDLVYVGKFLINSLLSTQQHGTYWICKPIL